MPYHRNNLGCIFKIQISLGPHPEQFQFIQCSLKSRYLHFDQHPRWSWTILEETLIWSNTLVWRMRKVSPGGWSAFVKVTQLFSDPPDRDPRSLILHSNMLSTIAASIYWLFKSELQKKRVSFVTRSAHQKHLRSLFRYSCPRPSPHLLNLITSGSSHTWTQGPWLFYRTRWYPCVSFLCFSHVELRARDLTHIWVVFMIKWNLTVSDHGTVGSWYYNKNALYFFSLFKYIF